jgi:hypothetical protein
MTGSYREQSNLSISVRQRVIRGRALQRQTGHWGDSRRGVRLAFFINKRPAAKNNPCAKIMPYMRAAATTPAPHRSWRKEILEVVWSVILWAGLIPAAIFTVGSLIVIAIALLVYGQ